MMLNEVDEENTGVVEFVVELGGRSPPVLADSPPVAMLVVVSWRAVTEVEETDVMMVDPGDGVLLVEVLEGVVDVIVTIIVVEDVRPPPPGVSTDPQSVTQVLELAAALSDERSAPRLVLVLAAGTPLVTVGSFELAEESLADAGGSLADAWGSLADAGGSLAAAGSADVTAIAKALSAAIVGPAGMQSSMPGYCEL